MIRSLFVVLVATAIGLTCTAQAAEHTSRRNCGDCGTAKSNTTKNTGTLRKLFSSRPVSTSSSWNHTHPKWRADRKVTGAAYQK
jgi:hypothetical protein